MKFKSEKLRELMKKKGIDTPRDLYDALTRVGKSATEASLRNWLDYGIRPGIDHVKMLADFFGVDFMCFFDLKANQ